MAGKTKQAQNLEQKALAAESKSAGMRMLLEEGYSVAEVRDVFDAPYGFVYGVARRAGLIEATPRATKLEPAPEPVKTRTRRAAKAEEPAKGAPRAKRTARKVTAKA